MRQLARAGDGDALVIVNTCAVTAAAERQSRQAIRRARRERPGARIVVTGCAAQIAPERFAAMPEVDRVLGNREKLEAASWSAGAGPDRVRVDDIAAVRETASHSIAGFEAHTRAFVQVQNGCDHRCTFCIIPYGRGPSRSVPSSRVVEQVRRLADGGVGEVVLSGVDLTAWGEDLPERTRLGALVRRVLREVPELPRLRLSSVDPVEIDDELWRAFAEEPRLMPHLHLSLQAGDDVVLKRMKRRHGSDDVRAVVRRARRIRPEVVFGADLIAGFPTETDAMFERTLDLVTELDLVHLHVFPYSSRPGTPAARMPPVPDAVRKVRAARLRETGARALRRFLEAKLGRAEELLMEAGDVGRTRDFARCRVAGGAAPGALVRVRVEALDGDVLVGRVVASDGASSRSDRRPLPPPERG
jgi:threonylcarbamoyladenosine tRNA methylthiotransferase MtaB